MSNQNATPPPVRHQGFCNLLKKEPAIGAFGDIAPVEVDAREEWKDMAIVNASKNTHNISPVD